MSTDTTATRRRPADGPPWRLPEPTAESETAVLLLALLLSTDLLFVSLHLVHVYTPLLNGWLYSIEADRGYAELFQYIKLFWIVLMLGWLAATRRSAVCASWLLLFGYLLVDDLLQLHERAGAGLADALALPAALGLRAVDFGELIVSTAAGTALLPLVLAAALRAPARQLVLSLRLGVLLGLLAVFGVGIDTLHSAVPQESLQAELLGVLEDGGEMMVASLTLWTVLLAGALPPRATGPGPRRPELRAAARAALP